MSYKRILVPLDGTRAAEAILPHVRVLARLSGAEIVLLRVPFYPAREYQVTDSLLLSSLHEAVTEEANAYLQQVSAMLAREGFKVSCRIDKGMIAERILAVCASVRADLIALATHGRGGLARWLQGSISDEVVRNSHTPVLLVRTAGAAASH